MRFRYLGIALLLALVVVDVLAEANPDGAIKKTKKKKSKSKKSKVPKIQADEPQTPKPPSISYPEPEYDYPTYYDEKDDYNEGENNGNGNSKCAENKLLIANLGKSQRLS